MGLSGKEIVKVREELDNEIVIWKYYLKKYFQISKINKTQWNKHKLKYAVFQKEFYCVWKLDTLHTNCNKRYSSNRLLKGVNKDSEDPSSPNLISVLVNFGSTVTPAGPNHHCKLELLGLPEIFTG